MKVSEQIAIMQAYEDGKTIEGKRYEETEWKSLEYVENYPFDFVANEYRIKPECKYRPYKSAEEAFEEAKKHDFWVMEKNTKCIYKFSARVYRSNDLDTTKEDVYTNGDLSDKWLRNFVWFDDGSPCGIKI